jgi:hypothetical protein
MSNPISHRTVGYRLRMFQNRTLRRIIGPKRGFGGRLEKVSYGGAS